MFTARWFRHSDFRGTPKSNERMAPGRSIFFRAGLALGVSFGAAVLAAVGLAIVDIYVTGHGQLSLLRPWIDWPEAGVVSVLSSCFGSGF